MSNDRERERALLEVAKFWRSRARFLERRLAEFGVRATRDPETLGESLMEHLHQVTVDEAIADAEMTADRQEARSIGRIIL